MIVYNAWERSANACANVERWASTIKRLHDEICAELEACRLEREAASDTYTASHVDQAVEACRVSKDDESEDGPGYVSFDTEAVGRWLAGKCPHCERVWQAGKERKEAKAALGKARRAVRSAGKAVLALRKEAA